MNNVTYGSGRLNTCDCNFSQICSDCEHCRCVTLPLSSCGWLWASASVFFCLFFGCKQIPNVILGSAFNQCQRICERWHSLERCEWIHEPCKKRNLCSSRLQVRHAEQAISLDELQNEKSGILKKKRKKKERKEISKQLYISKNEHENKKNNFCIYSLSFFFFTLLINPHLYAIAIETVSTRKVEYNLIYWPSNYFHFQRLFFSLTLLIK